MNKQEEILGMLRDILEVQKELLETKRKEIPLHPIDAMCELGAGTRCLNFRWEDGKLTAVPLGATVIPGLFSRILEYRTKDSGDADPAEEKP